MNAFKNILRIALGAVHHDELLYLLRVPVMTPPFTKTDPENTIIDQLTGWWANFAETGLELNVKLSTEIRCSLLVNFYFRNPSEGEYNSTIKWEPTTPDAPKYLEINDNPVMGTVPFPNRYDIWESLFPVKDECKSINV